MYLPDHNGSIGVFDSGIGGLAVANAISGQLPRESLLYVADNANAPYGQRTVEEIYDLSHRVTAFLLARGAKLIVVACNTATSAAIDRLRTVYPAVPFVGLEPALKPARGGQRVGILATEATLASGRYHQLRERHFGERPLWEDPCHGLVALIEQHPPDAPEIHQHLATIFASAPDLDTLVLGCTHYPLVLGAIRARLSAEVDIIDPAAAAARQVQRLLRERGLLDAGAARPVYDFCCSGGGAPLQRTLLRLPDLNGGRRWVIPGVELDRLA